MALRSDAILSRMLLEAEMMKFGIERARLNPKQVEVLKMAQDDRIRVLTLAGGTGQRPLKPGLEGFSVFCLSEITQVMAEFSGLQCQLSFEIRMTIA